jgi:hypothetical protein
MAESCGLEGYRDGAITSQPHHFFCIFSRYVDRANTGVGLAYANGRLHAAGGGSYIQMYDEKRIAIVL